jgi:MFS superfamily sulfate permease-like transporter
MNPAAVKELNEFGWSEVAIFALTVLVIVFVNLLVGIVFGFVLATIKLLHRLSRLNVKLDTSRADRATMTLSGAATFLALPKLASALENVPTGTNLRVRFSDLDYIDHASLDHLPRWAEQHEATDGNVEIDWDSLSGKYHVPTAA